MVTLPFHIKQTMLWLQLAILSLNVQSVVSRNVDPIEGAVVTFGVFQAGTTNNVIADTAFLHGTIRALTHSMSLLVQKTCQSHR